MISKTSTPNFGTLIRLSPQVFLSKLFEFVLKQVLRRHPRLGVARASPESVRNPDPLSSPLCAHPREAFADELRHGRGRSRAKVRQFDRFFYCPVELICNLFAS